MRGEEPSGMIGLFIPSSPSLELSLDRRFMISLVAGACYVAIHNALAPHLSRRWPLPRNGRRPTRTS
jgi:hypothetical protein